MSEEQVLVVKREMLEPLLASGEGLIKENTGLIVDRILASHLFVPRAAAEYDFDLRQIIPYVTIHCGLNFLLLRRTSKQTEKRLHDKYSLGIGGHINPSGEDGEDADVIINGLYKELNEEVLLGERGTLSFQGIINDESTSVSRVHLGLFYVLEVQSDEYSIMETDKMVGNWADEQGIMDVYDRMETWSQIVFDCYVRKSRECGRRTTH